MAMPARAQGRVVRATGRIPLHPDACPMIRGLAQPMIAGIAHHDGAAPSALFGDRGDPHPGAQHVIRSIDQ